MKNAVRSASSQLIVLAIVANRLLRQTTSAALADLVVMALVLLAIV